MRRDAPTPAAAACRDHPSASGVPPRRRGPRGFGPGPAKSWCRHAIPSACGPSGCSMSATSLPDDVGLPESREVAGAAWSRRALSSLRTESVGGLTGGCLRPRPWQSAEYAMLRPTAPRVGHRHTTNAVMANTGIAVGALVMRVLGADELAVGALATNRSQSTSRTYTACSNTAVACRRAQTSARCSSKISAVMSSLRPHRALGRMWPLNGIGAHHLPRCPSWRRCTGRGAPDAAS